MVVGNGSTELLFALAEALDYARAVIPVPSYTDYAAAVRLACRPVEELPLAEAAGFEIDWAALDRSIQDGDLVFLGQPNNPTGLWLDTERLGRLAHARPRTCFVIDEAFADFVEGCRSMVEDLAENVVVLRSLTKFYAIAGLRLGYAVASAAAAQRLRARLLPWSVNSLAQAVGLALLEEDDYVDQTVRYVAARRGELADALGRIEGLYVYPGRSNFLLVRIDRPDVGAPVLAERLLRRRIAIRTFAPGQHLDGRFFRVAVRTAEENAALCDSLEEIVERVPYDPVGNALRGVPGAPGVPDVGNGGSRIRHGTPRRAFPTGPLLLNGNCPTPALMFQGTSSNAGKSMLTAAFCRILLQDGFRVAPFKAQNMSLNSFVTRGRRRDGPGPGRAGPGLPAGARRADEPHPAQAQFGHRLPGDRAGQAGGQHAGGGVRGLQAAGLRRGLRVLRRAGRRVRRVVLEGAGSPGEVNLKSHDIVNMRMAQHAAAPVLVVGDIDRGGVFASFVGTMEVLAAWERKLVAGWIVNRFRGDAGLLGPALDYTLRHTGRPVLGVVPYLRDLNLPEEDSVEFKAMRSLPSTFGRGAGGEGEREGVPSWHSASFPDSPHPNPLPEGEGETAATPATAAVQIALIDLPHISNFTDFDAFRVEPDVRLRIVRGPSDLGQPDAVLVGGSKNTLGDLAYLRSGGLAAQIDRLARAGRCEVVGICGGFQMLGTEIRDPLGIESAAVPFASTVPTPFASSVPTQLAPAATPGGDDSRGLGLLPLRTVLAAEKTLRRTTACHAASGLEVTGYEIHHGQTDVGRLCAGVSPARRTDRGRRLARRPRLGHVSARRLRRRPLPPLVHRPPPRPPRSGAAWPGGRPVRHRAGPGSPGRSRSPRPARGTDLPHDGIAMNVEYQVVAALLVDLALGDPRWLPHPVRGIGRLADGLETLARRWLGDGRIAGLAAALAVLAITGGAAWGAITLAGRWHPLAADVVGVALIYTTIAARDLAAHSMAVFAALTSGDLPEARRRVSLIVGRDTGRLDDAGVVRAAVESVAESTVDGVTAPVFFALLAGPVGAMVYRAINTLDSMFGHQDDALCPLRLGRRADRRSGQLSASSAHRAAGLPGGDAPRTAWAWGPCGSWSATDAIMPVPIPA